MGMPQIPEGKHRPSFEETMVDLLESIALEEMAMAHIMNAEGEKLQELIRKYCCREVSLCELEYACKSVKGMMNSLIMKEWLLMNKLDTIIEVNEKVGGGPSVHTNYPNCQRACQSYPQRTILPNNSPLNCEKYPKNQNTTAYISKRCDINYECYPKPMNQNIY